MPVVPTQEIVQRAFDRALRRRRDQRRQRPDDGGGAGGGRGVARAAHRPDVGQDREVDRGRRALRDVDRDDPVAHGSGRAPSRPLPRARGDQPVPREGLELRALRRLEAVVEENTRQTIEVVAEARRYGALVEGEIEGVQARRGDGRRRGRRANRPSRPRVDFVRATGVDVFAPAIGNAHGMYTTTPKLDSQRVTDIVEATGIPVALHGGTGMTADQFRDLIAPRAARRSTSRPPSRSRSCSRATTT